MGTRALTRVFDEEDQIVLYMYSQSDGYPSGLGRVLRDIVAPLTLVNGIGDDERVANGMGCLAAQIVAGVKSCAGGFYLQAPSDDYSWAEYVYDFRSNLPGHPDWIGGKKEQRHIVLKVLQVLDRDKVLFEGPVSEFDPDAV